MTKFAVKNHITMLLLAAILLIAGTMSYRGLPKESFPEIKIPLIFVTVIYPGATPEDMESLVTEKIEDKLEGLDGLKAVTSVSGDGYSSITVEFYPTVEVETALRRVKDKVDEAQPNLPVDVEKPFVQELNFSNIPVFVISLSADYGTERLEELAEALRTRIASVPGVLDAKVTGKQEREIAIDADPDRLKQYGLSLNDLLHAVQAQHQNIPGGVLRAGGNRFSVTLTGEIRDPEGFRDIIVRSEEGALVRLGDVADVGFRYARDRSTIFRLNGENSLAISVTKRTGVSIIDLVDDIKALVEESKPGWPAGTRVEYTMDQAKDIRMIVNELQNHIISGVLLVVLLLSFFLGFRNSFFISLAIPFSMMIGFLVLDWMDVSLNMVVLFSLIVALGMLVDDGIVVMENIYRHLQMGKDRVAAAIDGAREVTWPVIMASATTIMAFIPILFIPGIMGQFMKYLPITVMVTLVGSLFVAFLFNPVFAALFMRSGGKSLDGETGDSFEKYRKLYRRAVSRVIVRPVLVAVFCVLFIIGGIVSYARFGTGADFFPITEPNVVAVEVTGPLGIDIAATDSALQIVEQALFEMPADMGDVESYSGVVGFGKVDFGDRQPESHQAYVDVKFTDFESRRVSSWTSMQWMRENIPPLLPGWRVSVKQQNEGPPQGYPVELEISGPDFAVLSVLADSVERRLARVPGLVNIDNDYDPVRPEIAITIDRVQAKRLGISTSEAAMAVRGAIHGFEAGKFRVGRDEHDIMVRLNPETRESFGGLDRITVPHDGDNIPLSSFARVEQQASLASVRRLDGRRTVQVWAELEPGTRDEATPKAAAMAAVRDLALPPGYTMVPGSGNREQEETQEYLGGALFVALGLVLFTMVLKFNSIAHPFMVLAGIFLSFGGAFWGLLMMNVTFSIIMSGIGIIALAGVVAKNSIVLIEFINKLREDGLELREAIVEAGAMRLRPVVLTSVTTMIALLPMATGVGFDFLHFEPILRSETSMFWRPMAWALFWGLFFNTALILFVIPTIYYAWEKLKGRIARKFGRAAA